MLLAPCQNDDFIWIFLYLAQIKCIRFDASSRFLLTTGDKYVRVFHNVPGFKVAIADLELKLKKATSNAMRDRCHQQINEYQSLINLIEK